MPQKTIDHKGNDHQQSCNQTQFLADDGKDEVRVVLRHEAELLATVAQAFAGKAAAAKRNHRLVSLHPLCLLGFLHVQPGVNALGTHRVVVDEQANG